MSIDRPVAASTPKNPQPAFGAPIPTLGPAVTAVSVYAALLSSIAVGRNPVKAPRVPLPVAKPPT